MIASTLKLVKQWLGIDAYFIIAKWWERRIVRLSFPKNGNLSDNGLGLFFEVGQTNSISKVGFDFARKLVAAGFETSICDTTPPNRRTPFKSPFGQELGGFLSNTSKFRKIVILGGTDQFFESPYEIYREVFFEYGKGIERWRPNIFKGAGHILVFSDFCRDIVSSVAPPSLKIFKIRYPFIFPSMPSNKAKDDIRKRFGIPAGAFSVFFNFSYGSSLERKNPAALAQAFAKSFGNVPTARLVFKTMAGNRFPELARKLHSTVTELGIADKTIFIDDTLSANEVLDLTAAIDVYASLHRGEGLGLGMLEAMSLGIPVVATGYGGNTDFCNDGTAFSIPFSVKRWQPACGFPKHMGEWAEPDVDAAAAILKEIFRNGELRRRKALFGQRFVHDFYSLANFRRDIESLHAQSGQQRVESAVR